MSTVGPTQGQQFGGYKLSEQLGRGGMGVVYRAEHLHLGRIVALKVLAPELSSNADFRERFLRESRLAATLDHPNVVTVYDAGDIDGALYLAMRLVQGEDLSGYLGRSGALQPQEALDMLDQVAGALDAAHALGLVHRDVKPGNVLVEGKRCYLTDFGLTKRTHGDTTAVPAMTATGVFLGTPDYAAPEQISGSQVDSRTDVYALGGMLHECLTGSRPYPRDSQVAVLYAQLHEPPPRPSEVRAGLPPAIDDVMARALAKAPSDRYSTCSELMAAARQALAGVETVARPAPAAPTAAAGAAGTAPAAGGGAPATPPAAAGAVPGTTPGHEARTAEAADARPTAAKPITPVTDALGREQTAAPERKGRRLAPLLAILAAVIVAGVVLALVLGGGGDDEGAGETGAGGGGSGETEQPRVVGRPLEVGNRPFGVAVGEGVLWVANNDDDTVSRLPTGGAPGTDIPVGEKPFGITRAGGAFWVANTDSDSVIRIEVANGRAGEPIPVGDSPFFLTADESSVFVSNGGDGTITVLDARTSEVAGDPIQVGGEPRGIVSSGTAVWVADKANDNIKRIVNGRVVRTIPVGDNPVGVAFGNMALWVANKDDDTVSRIDLRGQGNRVKNIRVGDEPYGIAFGEGFAWVTNAKSNEVMRLDPNSGEVVGEPIPIPGQPVGIDVRNGQVWVTSNDAGTVTRIDPGS